MLLRLLTATSDGDVDDVARDVAGTELADLGVVADGQRGNLSGKRWIASDRLTGHVGIDLAA